MCLTPRVMFLRINNLDLRDWFTVEVGVLHAKVTKAVKVRRAFRKRHCAWKGTTTRRGKAVVEPREVDAGNNGGNDAVDDGNERAGLAAER